jgi:hypothetical protein
MLMAVLLKYVSENAREPAKDALITCAKRVVIAGVDVPGHSENIQV